MVIDVDSVGKFPTLRVKTSLSMKATLVIVLAYGTKIKVTKKTKYTKKFEIQLIEDEAM